MQGLDRRTFALGLAAATGMAHAQGAGSYPDRPVRAIVPFVPGGNADVTARLLAQALTEKLGQPFVVENKGGAGGLLGGTAVARAAPDGYTAMFGTGAPIFASAVLAGAKAPYTLRDLQPVGRISTVPLVLLTHPASPFQRFEDLAAAARKQPDAIRFGHAGNGTTNHVAGLQLQRALGTRFIIAPYKGSAAAVQDLLAAQIDCSAVEITACIQFITSGRLRALAIIGDDRVQAAPEVRTLEQIGVKGVDVTTFAGVMLPRNVPQAIVDRLASAMEQVMAEPAFRDRLQQLGGTPAPLRPQAFLQFLNGQEEKYRRLVQEGLLQPE